MAASAAPVAVRKMHERAMTKEITSSLKDYSLRSLNADLEKVTEALCDLEQELSEKLGKDLDPTERRFNMFMSLVAFVSVCTLTLEIEFGENSDEMDFWYFTELFFLCVFFIEILIRIAWQQSEWPWSGWNIFDVVCIVPSLLSVLSVSVRGLSNLALFNMLRLIKLARLVRIMKMMKSYRPMYDVFMLWVQAMKGICNVGVMIAVTLLLYAIIATVVIGHDDELNEIILGDHPAERYYGSIRLSMYSLFQMITLEGFEKKTLPLVQAQPLLIIFFFSFVMVFTFGLLNMLIGLVVEGTLRESEKLRRAQFFLDHPFQASKLREVFRILDKEKTGTISRTQFETQVNENKDAIQCLDEIGFPLCNKRDFFNIVDLDGNGFIDMNEFMAGCLALYACPTGELHHVSTHACVRALDHRIESMLERTSVFDEKLEGQTSLIKHFETTVMSPSPAAASDHAEEEMGDTGGFTEAKSASNCRPCGEATVNSVLEQVLQIKDQIIEHLSRFEAELQAKTCQWNQAGILRVDGRSLKHQIFDALSAEWTSMLEERLSYQFDGLETSLQQCLNRTIVNLFEQNHSQTMVAGQSGIMHEQMELMRRLECLTTDLHLQHHQRETSLDGQLATLKEVMTDSIQTVVKVIESKTKELEPAIACVHPDSAVFTIYNQENPGAPDNFRVGQAAVTATICSTPSASALCSSDYNYDEHLADLVEIKSNYLNTLLTDSFALWRHACTDDKSSRLACVGLEPQQQKPKRRCVSCGHKTSKLECSKCGSCDFEQDASLGR